jgi:hypothetical protein
VQVQSESPKQHGPLSAGVERAKNVRTNARGTNRSFFMLDLLPVEPDEDTNRYSGTSKAAPADRGAAGEVYTPSQIADEVNRRYRNELKKPLIVPTASTILRRMLLTGEVRLVRSGTAHIQAVYIKR